MSAAATERARLAAIGRDLLTDKAGRADALLHATAPGAIQARGWTDLTAVPDWLRLPVDRRKHLALKVALLAMAQALAQSIDGAWLGALAERTDEDVLDWAMAQADDETLPGLPRMEPEALERTGLSILAASLPPALRGCLPPAGAIDVTADGARALVERAR